MGSEPRQFLGVPSPGADRAEVLLLPVPVEKTVCYGTGTRGGPKAIIDASLELETFDEETLVEFTDRPDMHTLPPVADDGDIEQCLKRIADHVRPLRPKFVLSLGGEHSITYGLVTGLADDLSKVTIVQLDAHADLALALRGRHWSHGTVMRRLLEKGCGFVQIGIRSLTREEYRTATDSPRVTTFYAHRLDEQWPEVLDTIRNLQGDVYLTIDVDGLDPSILPSTGTPMPGGLSWRQAMEIIRLVMTHRQIRLIGADVVEFVPSPAPPGCDPVAARLVAKVLAWRRVARRTS
jgi:agmatinase